jgi:hypothetical protein
MIDTRSARVNLEGLETKMAARGRLASAAALARPFFQDNYLKNQYYDFSRKIFTQKA